MKKLLNYIGAVVLNLTALFIISVSIHPQEVKAADTFTPVYRLYCPVNGEHLYTTDAHERDVLYREHGWGYEGVGWYQDLTYSGYASANGTPVYRLYNSGLRNHLYTSDQTEINTLLQIREWSIDNDGKPLFYSGGSESIYRVYNRNLNGMHHLTTDVNEYWTLPVYGWDQEGATLSARAVGTPIQTQYYPAQIPEPDIVTGAMYWICNCGAVIEGDHSLHSMAHALAGEATNGYNQYRINIAHPDSR